MHIKAHFCTKEPARSWIFRKNGRVTLQRLHRLDLCLLPLKKTWELWKRWFKGVSPTSSIGVIPQKGPAVSQLGLLCHHRRAETSWARSNCSKPGHWGSITWPVRWRLSTVLTNGEFIWLYTKGSQTMVAPAILSFVRIDFKLQVQFLSMSISRHSHGVTSCCGYDLPSNCSLTIRNQLLCLTAFSERAEGFL